MRCARGPMTCPPARPIWTVTAMTAARRDARCVVPVRSARPTGGSLRNPPFTWGISDERPDPDAACEIRLGQSPAARSRATAKQARAALGHGLGGLAARARPDPGSDPVLVLCANTGN